MTIAEKYSNLKNKTIEEIVLGVVEDVASRTDKNLQIVCGWWNDTSEPHGTPESEWFDLMAGECYHKEINDIMRKQGFHVYEDYGHYRWRARTTYRL